MKRVLSRVVAVVLAASFSDAHAQPAGDAEQGHALARQVCGDCHDVQVPKGRSPHPGAPAFVDLAETPGMTATALTIALTTPHAGMPMFRLSAEQRADMIAYILGLAGKRP